MKQRKLRSLLPVVLCVILFTTLATAVGCKNNNCIVTFDVDGGVSVAALTVKKGSAIGKLPFTSKDGYEFVGWSDKKGGSANVDENYVVNGNVTLFAVFAIVQDYNCSVSFSTSGTAVKNTTVKRGSEIGSLPFTDKLGYTFSGWYYDKELTNLVFSDDVITQDVTLYAGFDKTDIESVLPEYTELSISTDIVDYVIELQSDVAIDERNLDNVVSVTALYGEMPKMSVSATEDGTYALSPLGEYKNGGVYKIALTDERVHFVDLDIAHDGDYTDDKQIRTLFLSVNVLDEVTVSVKNGVFELNASAVVFSEDANTFTAPKNVYDNLPFDTGAVVHIVGADGEDDRYIKILGAAKSGEEYVFSFADVDDPDEVYDDFELNVGGISVSNDKTTPDSKTETDAETAAVVAELYNSKGTQAVTAMLASALNASPALQAITDNPYRDRVTDEYGKVFTIKGLLDDLEIKVTLGTAKNANFNGIGISQFDDTPWTMLAIEFIYETDIKDKVKLEATIKITQYVFVGLAASANKSSGDFKAEITPYSQTDIDFTVLVCTMSKDDDGNDKEEKKDISVEVERLASGEGDSSNIIQDVQEMLENKGDAIELCRIPMFSAAYTVGGVVSINIDLNFVVKVSFAAGVRIEATLLEATTIGVVGNYKTRTVDCYRRSAMGSDRYIFDFYAYGYLGVKAGIEGELTVSFVGLKQVLRAGVGIEVGAYADLYGYLHYHAEERRVFKDIDTNGRHFQTLEGGVYFESGIYIELKAFVGIGKKEYGVSKEFKFKLLQAGDKYLYVEACENDDLTVVFNENEDNSVSLEGLIPAEGNFMDITTGEIEKRVIPSKNIKLISNTNLFRVDGSNNALVADVDKVAQRLQYGIPYGTISLYYKGPNILFASSYLNENIPELKGFKELCKVTVVYLPEGTSATDVDKIGKEVTVTYKVKSALGEQIVKTEKVVAGQYYQGGLPDEVIAYCRKNGLLTEVDGNAVKFDGPTSGKYVLSKDVTYVFSTVEAQRFVAVKYKSEQDFYAAEDVWTVDIMAIGYNELPEISDAQNYTPKNIGNQFFVVTPDGDKKVMGNEYLSKYDLYMRGTYGYETNKVLASVNGTQQTIDAAFAAMHDGTGELAEYAEFFTYTLEAEYIKGMHKVYFYAPNGDRGEDNVKYGEVFRVPDYWINNINQSTSTRLVGWDTDGDGKADILPSEQFTVVGDMVLRPVTTAQGYTITVIKADGSEMRRTVEAGSKIPDDIVAVVNSAPETPTAPDEGSFYTDSYWRIVTSDFVAGDEGTAYFKNVYWYYNGDITVMPACDLMFSCVEGDLYHYVTLIDTTDGHFTYKDDDGEVVSAKTVKIAVADGGTVSASEDYKAKELKYHAPDNVSIFASHYIDDSGDELDLFNSRIYGSATYNHTIWVRYDGSHTISFNVSVYYLNEVTTERIHYVTGLTDETKIKELLDKYDSEYNYLTSQEYLDSLGNAEFRYKLLDGFSSSRKEIVDGYGITQITYVVQITKEVRRYTFTVNYNSKNNTDFVDTVSYGITRFAGDKVTNEVEKVYEDGTKCTYYYDLEGYDIDGDGVVDILPGTFVVVKGDITLTAIWKKEPSAIS